ncbi:IS3 family transposase [Lysinibacillus sp. FSL K6-4013]|uniref:IS3 family transposase n=1 Tax=Lysinibacillus sp. FSL K6-4013 TaxID=2921504 RepID=UPI00315A78B7
MARSKHTIEVKLNVLHLLNEGYYSINELCEKFLVTKQTIQIWKIKYEVHGVEGLIEATSWTKYSKELKLEAVEDYLKERLTLLEILAQYKISSISVLKSWVKKYTSHSEIKDSGKGMSQTMTKGRKTTFEERIQIVNYCLKSQKNYQLAAQAYDVSYQQVYHWVKKFEATGEEGLRDHRGRTKNEVELTAEEKLRLEIKRIERENEHLRAENLFFKKVRGNRKEESLSQIRLQQRYLAIQELHQEEKLAILLLCEIAGVSRAAYYKWLSRKPSNREVENEAISKDIDLLYHQVDGIYGYRRMTLTINRQRKENNQATVNEKRIYRLMQVSGLKSVIRRKRKPYRKSPAHHVAENVLNRAFTSEKPNEKWCTDVTEFKYGNGKKAYLSAIIDLYDGSIVSYVFGHSNNNSLVFKTIKSAIQSLQSGEQPLIHSDRGFQYTSKGFKRIVETANMTQSMSRVGRCIDNGPIESFWGTLKCEKYYLHKFDSYEELKLAIDDYIHFYNYYRYQKRLNGLSPLEFRAQAA